MFYILIILTHLDHSCVR